METKKVKNGRIDSIDIFRGIGIIIMVMGHIGFGSIFDHLIHAFHMPMFYFISGMFFKAENVDGTRVIDFVKKKVYTLIIPYLFFGILLYLIWLKWNWANEVDMYVPLMHFLGRNTWGGVQISSALWFLTSLFFTEIIYFIMFKIIKNTTIFHTVIVVLSIAGNLEMKILPDQLPWALGPALVGLGFFDIAHVLFSKNNTLIAGRLWDIPTKALIVFSFIIMGGIFLNGDVNMRLSVYAHIPLFWINGICSIVIGINFSKKLDLKLSIFVKNILTYIGRNSIIFLCMNQLIIAYIYKLIPYTAFNRFVGMVISLGILGVCCFIINKSFLRRIIGR